jgi:hypothetical protein
MSRSRTKASIFALACLSSITVALGLFGSVAAEPEAKPETPAEAPPAEPSEEDPEEGQGDDGADAASQSGDEGPAESSDVADLDSLRAQYFKLRDRLFQSRARAATVASALYSTKISVRLDYKSARFYTVTRATIRLDGANIFSDDGSEVGKNDSPRFEGYVAPGRHTMSIRIEATGKDDERFTSVIDNTFSLQAPAGKDLEIRAKAEDDGSISFNWSKKESGSYKLHLNVSVKAVKRGKKKKGLRSSQRSRRGSGKERG